MGQCRFGFGAHRWLPWVFEQNNRRSFVPFGVLRMTAEKRVQELERITGPSAARPLPVRFGRDDNNQNKGKSKSKSKSKSKNNRYDNRKGEQRIPPLRALRFGRDDNKKGTKAGALALAPICQDRAGTGHLAPIELVSAGSGLVRTDGCHGYLNRTTADPSSPSGSSG
jgi:hypothetical protein